MSIFSGELGEIAKNLLSLYPDKRSALIPLCHLAQSADGYLSKEAIESISSLVGVSKAEVVGTASFYDMFFFEHPGDYVINICTNVSCMLAGAYELLSEFEEQLGVKAGAITEDGKITLREFECLAACDKAPCVQVNYRYFAPLNKDEVGEFLRKLRKDELDVPKHGTLMRNPRKYPLAVSTLKAAAEDPGEVESK